MRYDDDDPFMNKRTLLVLLFMMAAMGLSIGIHNCRKNLRSKEKPCLIVQKNYEANPTVLFYSEYPEKSYVDKKPFGSLDYMIENVKGKRTERKPTKDEYQVFSRLEKEAKEKGFVKK
ncbi:MAG: hypothetical protein KAT43_05875 [Nanoarchaeota archaeon]|nr:hypothetical protein [Nanoarchaeota archaeon]